MGLRGVLLGAVEYRNALSQSGRASGATWVAQLRLQCESLQPAAISLWRVGYDLCRYAI